MRIRIMKESDENYHKIIVGYGNMNYTIIETTDNNKTNEIYKELETKMNNGTLEKWTEQFIINKKGEPIEDE